MGRQLTDTRGAFVVPARNLCVQQTFDAILVDMEQGVDFQGNVWKDLLEKGPQCSVDVSSSSDEQISASQMSGMYIMHGVLTAIALALHLFWKYAPDLYAKMISVHNAREVDRDVRGGRGLAKIEEKEVSVVLAKIEERLTSLEEPKNETPREA